MRRSIDQAFLDLRQQIGVWASGEAKPDIRVFVYPPEWEAEMLKRFPAFAQDCANEGRPIEVVDVGQGFAQEIEQRRGMAERLEQQEQLGTDRILQNLGALSSRYLDKVLKSPIEPPTVCRLLVNTGSLATFTSYSAITNELHGRDILPGPTSIAFPGEGDERSLNLLRLRADTNYRVPRI